MSPGGRREGTTPAQQGGFTFGEATWVEPLGLSRVTLEATRTICYSASVLLGYLPSHTLLTCSSSVRMTPHLGCCQLWAQGTTSPAILLLLTLHLRTVIGGFLLVFLYCPSGVAFLDGSGPESVAKQAKQGALDSDHAGFRRKFASYDANFGQ